MQRFQARTSLQLLLVEVAFGFESPPPGGAQAGGPLGTPTARLSCKKSADLKPSTKYWVMPNERAFGID